MVEKTGVKSWGWKVGGWNVLQSIGKASPFQLIVMALLEIVLYETNEHIGRYYIKARINQIIGLTQRYTYRVLQTIQWNLYFYERAVLGSARAALKFKYEI